MLTQDRLKELLHYDPATGVFLWLVRTSNRICVGSEAGRIDTAGYRAIRIDGELYYAHRLAFFYMLGEWPEITDHKNRCRADNRWINLRSTDHCGNSHNKGPEASSKSGYRGVSWHKGARKWAAEKWLRGVKHYLGLFETPEAAYEAITDFQRAQGI